MLQNIIIPEVLGTAILIVIGSGTVANVLLPDTKGRGGGWLLINVGWAMGIFLGVAAAYRSGGHLNPAVTVGIIVSGAHEWSNGLPITFTSVVAYLGAQFVGAFLGAVLAYLAYRQHFAKEAPAGDKLAVFANGPQLRRLPWNAVTEAIATFVLVYVVLMAGGSPSSLGPLFAALVVLGIGAGLGGPTGYSLNPARDVGPRLAHAVLPIPGKGSSDWSFSLPAVAGPLLGGSAAGLLASAVGLPVAGG